MLGERGGEARAAPGVGTRGRTGVWVCGGTSGACVGGFAGLGGAGQVSATPPHPRMGAHWPSRSRGCGVTPVPADLSRRGKLRHRASPGTVGTAGTLPPARSLLETSTPSAGAELGSLTWGSGTHEAAHHPQWVPAPVGASPGR